jgi:hypothetical protein
MIVLRIEHPVPDYEGWKKAFEHDPLGRKRSGVKSYRVYRPVDDPKYVIVDLLFATLNEADTMLSALHKLWGKVEGTVMFNARTRVLEISEDNIY